MLHYPDASLFLCDNLLAISPSWAFQSYNRGESSFSVHVSKMMESHPENTRSILQLGSPLHYVCVTYIYTLDDFIINNVFEVNFGSLKKKVGGRGQ